MTRKTLKLGIDLFDADCRYYGIGEYEYCLGSCLGLKAKEWAEKNGVELYLLVKGNMLGAFGQDVKYVALTKRRMRLINGFPFLKYFLLPRFDLVHFTHQLPRLHVRVAPMTLVTIHDINFIHGSFSRFAKYRKQRRFLRGIRHATHLSFISHFAATDVLSNFRLNQPYRVILNGVTDISAIPVSDNDLKLPPHYLFHISRMAPKKNVHLMVAMMKHLPQYELVLAGYCPPSYRATLDEIIRKEALTNVRFLGNVTEEQKALLFRQCDAFLFPSLSEGFGLPVVEAMYFGKPVFCSRLTSLPEVGGDVACYFDVLQPAEMAQTVVDGMKAFGETSDQSLRLRAHAEQFSWPVAADAYLKYYLDIARSSAKDK